MITTSESVENIWEGDLLDRQKEALHLQRYLENAYTKSTKTKDSSFVLNINSEWGHGKTWFLKRLAQQLEVNYSVVYFDAWKNDFTKDALLSFVSVICSELEKQFRTDDKILEKVSTIKNALSSLTLKSLPILAGVAAKQLTGMSIETLLELTLEKDEKNSIATGAGEVAKLATNSAVDSFVKVQNTIEQFESAVKALVADIKNLPIFIFVDELDRCRPTYAIELLESIKHLFSVHGVYFVVATDTTQLSHSIKSVYGEGFNSTAYLKRFFYAEYSLAEPIYDNMAKFLFKNFSLSNKLFMPEPLLTDYNFSGFFAKTAEFFRLTARDQEQVFNILETILLSSEKYEIHYIFILLLICLKQKFEAYSANVHANQSSLSELLKEVNSQRKTRHTKIKTFLWSSHGSENKDHSMIEIFYFYINLLNDDVNQIRVPSSSHEHFAYQANTATYLLKNTQINSREGTRIGSNELFTHFKLLTQAGRITVN